MAAASGGCIEAFGEPHLDHGLTRDTKALCFCIEGIDHPGGEINVDPLDLAAGAARLGVIEVGSHVGLALVEEAIKLFCAYILQLLPSLLCVPK